MSTSDAARLLPQTISTAVQLLEAQDGLLFPVAHVIGVDGRCLFIGKYNGDVTPHPLRALDTLRRSLRDKPYRSTAIVYGVAMPHELGRHALCIEFESLDAAPQTILVPFVITRPWARSARIMTYAPVFKPGQNRIFRAERSTDEAL